MCGFCRIWAAGVALAALTPGLNSELWVHLHVAPVTAADFRLAPCSQLLRGNKISMIVILYYAAGMHPAAGLSLALCGATDADLGVSVLQARAQQLSLLLSVMDDTQKLFEMDAGILELARAPALALPEMEGPSCGASPQRDDTSQPSASRGASPMQQDDID